MRARSDRASDVAPSARKGNVKKTRAEARASFNALRKGSAYQPVVFQPATVATVVEQIDAPLASEL